MARNSSKLLPLILIAVASYMLLGEIDGFSFAGSRTPVGGVSKAAPATLMRFKFLKDLGIQKPDWLPDFAGNAKNRRLEEAKKKLSDVESAGGSEADLTVAQEAVAKAQAELDEHLAAKEAEKKEKESS
eukprot:TRINITY_DN25559_c0_g1_i1.p3 TRINITY_DN25559_c0_g1~~TRINITY_DN25559_c0_g1_i1.p3  ORF type:complete len:129 (-),score=49.74 TRINITY_DN25559_c0_g1_i1:148-534(-)